MKFQKMYQMFSQASPWGSTLKQTPVLYCMPTSHVLCLTPSPLIASLLLKFFPDTDTGLSKHSPNTLRDYCICVLDSCFEFKESDSVFVKRGLFSFGLNFIFL